MILNLIQIWVQIYAQFRNFEQLSAFYYVNYMIKCHILDLFIKKERGMNHSLRALSQRMSVCTNVITLRIVAITAVTNNSVV